MTRDAAVVQGRALLPPKSCEDEEDISSRRLSGKADDGLDGDGTTALGKEGTEEAWVSRVGSSGLFPSGWSPRPQLLAKLGPVPRVSVSGWPLPVRQR